LERYNTRADDRDGKSENFDVILRRFFRDVQQSGILTEVKKRRFRTKDVSRSKKRIAAKRKAEVRKIKRGY
jgi:ribosomal protein S21